MTEEHNIKGIKIWITVEQLVDFDGNDLGYIAYWNRSKPGGLILGESIRINDKILTFKSEKDAETYTIQQFSQM